MFLYATILNVYIYITGTCLQFAYDQDLYRKPVTMSMFQPQLQTMLINIDFRLKVHYKFRVSGRLCAQRYLLYWHRMLTIYFLADVSLQNVG